MSTIKFQVMKINLKSVLEDKSIRKIIFQYQPFFIKDETTWGYIAYGAKRPVSIDEKYQGAAKPKSWDYIVIPVEPTGETAELKADMDKQKITLGNLEITRSQIERLSKAKTLELSIRPLPYMENYHATVELTDGSTTETAHPSPPAPPDEPTP
jgi:hypothetical protein